MFQQAGADGIPPPTRGAAGCHHVDVIDVLKFKTDPKSIKHEILMHVNIPINCCKIIAEHQQHLAKMILNL